MDYLIDDWQLVTGVRVILPYEQTHKKVCNGPSGGNFKLLI